MPNLWLPTGRLSRFGTGGVAAGDCATRHSAARAKLASAGTPVRWCQRMIRRRAGVDGPDDVMRKIVPVE